MSQISLIHHTQSYEGTLAVLKPLKQELTTKLQNLNKVVIKINFVTTQKELATTPVESVRAFINFIKPFYSGQIIIAEEASIGNTQQGFQDHGFTQLTKEHPQVEIFDSADDEIEQVELTYPHGSLTLPLAKIYTDSPFVVSMCRAKTHDTVVVTLSIKNLLVGAIQGGLSTRGEIHRGQDINWILQSLAQHIYPDLSIIDGVVGMEGDGPSNGNPIQADWLIASLDPLAADSLATYLMGFNINDVGYLNLIRQNNLGKLYPEDKIEIIGDEAEPLKKQFKPHQSFEQQRKWH